MNYQKKIFLLIALSTLVRLIVANSIELGNDEVYYWTYALHLQYNYFDHPPMVGLLIRLTTANLLLHSALFVRLGAILASAICTWLIYQAGKAIHNERTGWLAALLYTSSIYSSIIAGTFILPDSPQMIFWLWSILLLFNIKKKHSKGRPTLKLWLWFGISTGLCIMSKVHGIFLWGAVGMYAVLIDRKWLQQKNMYLSAVVTLLIISPILIWNIQNNFITYNYHGNRVNLNGGGFNIDSFGRELIGSFFYNNPINFVLIWISIFSIRRIKQSLKDILLLLFLGLPLILVLLGVSMFRDTFPHWSGPGYTALILLAALHIEGKQLQQFVLVPRAIKAALALIVVIVIAGVGVIHFYPGTLSTASNKNIGEGDFTLDMYGWEQTGKQFDSLHKMDIAKGIMTTKAPIVVNKWFPAAHIDFYVANKTHQNTYALGDLFELHHYHWLNQYKPALQKHDDAYCIMPSNNYEESTLAFYQQQFDSVYAPVVIPIYRGNMLCKQIFVYRLKGYK